MVNKLITTDPIPMEQWSRDHWSLFLYVETRVVDHNGTLDHRYMRKAKLDPRTNDKNPTLLKEDTEAWLTEDMWHDDFACLDDLESAGLIINTGSALIPLLVLTEYGWVLSHLLRRNRADKRLDKDFMPPAREEDMKTDVSVVKAQPGIHFSEGHYREAMSYVFDFFNDNVDGILECNDRADFCWHLLGGMVAKGGDYWTRQQHIDSLLKLKTNSIGGQGVWKTFFDKPLDY